MVRLFNGCWESVYSLNSGVVIFGLVCLMGRWWRCFDISSEAEAFPRSLDGAIWLMFVDYYYFCYELLP